MERHADILSERERLAERFGKREICRERESKRLRVKGSEMKSEKYLEGKKELFGVSERDFQRESATHRQNDVRQERDPERFE